MRYLRAPRIIEATIHESVDAADQATAETYVPTSPEGEEIKAYVRQPRQMRQPVGYKLGFLSNTTPIRPLICRKACATNCTPGPLTRATRPQRAPLPATSSTAC